MKKLHWICPLCSKEGFLNYTEEQFSGREKAHRIRQEHMEASPGCVPADFQIIDQGEFTTLRVLELTQQEMFRAQTAPPYGPP